MRPLVHLIKEFDLQGEQFAPVSVDQAVQPVVDVWGTGAYNRVEHERQGPANVAVQVGSTVPTGEVWLILFASAHFTDVTGANKTWLLLVENVALAQETAISPFAVLSAADSTVQSVLQRPFFLPDGYRLVARMNVAALGFQLDFDFIRLTRGETAAY